MRAKINLINHVDIRDLRDALAIYRRHGNPDITVRAYKFVTLDYQSPWASNGTWTTGRRAHIRPIKYDFNTIIRVPDADTSTLNDCGAGINVAHLDWCTHYYNWPDWVCRNDMRFIALEFKLSDVAMLTPYSSKFRLYQCRVVGEVDETGKLIAWLRNGGINRRHK